MQLPDQDVFAPPDQVWSTILCQLERTAQPHQAPQPLRRRPGDAQRFVVRLVARFSSRRTRRAQAFSGHGANGRKGDGPAGDGHAGDGPMGDESGGGGTGDGSAGDGPAGDGGAGTGSAGNGSAGNGGGGDGLDGHEASARAADGRPADESDEATVFDAMSCLLLTCRQLGWPVAVRSHEDACPLLSFTTADSAAAVQRQLAGVIAECNALLREGPWKVVATNRYLE